MKYIVLAIAAMLFSIGCQQKPPPPTTTTTGAGYYQPTK